MDKTFFWLCCAVALLFVARSGRAADSATNPVSPLTPSLANEIQKNPYVDESVQTTNGNVVGIFTQVVSDRSGKPVLGVIQGYDNVTRTKDFLPIPWPMFKFDPQSRRIEISTAADQLRKAPKYKQEQIAHLVDTPEMEKIYQHFGVSMGGGSVAVTMGTQSGQGSSLSPPATNEAQPGRGSVGVMYILGVLAVTALGLGYFVRRRT